MIEDSRYLSAVSALMTIAVALSWGVTARAQRGGPVPPNAPLTVTAYCDPCTVEPGKTSAIHAYAKDPNRKPLTVRWTAKAGTFAGPTDRQTVWTAPMQDGQVDLTVTADNGTGGTASNTITITVRSLQKPEST